MTCSNCGELNVCPKCGSKTLHSHMRIIRNIIKNVDFCEKCKYNEEWGPIRPRDKTPFM